MSILNKIKKNLENASIEQYFQVLGKQATIEKFGQEAFENIDSSQVEQATVTPTPTATPVPVVEEAAPTPTATPDPVVEEVTPTGSTSDSWYS
ncbi:MAG: hypothetical protein RLN62_01575 [Rickettsiales bacterium]